MSVRYKFKNDLEFATLPCDGFDVSLRDLKRAVVRAKKLGRVTDFDLVVTNSQTAQTYSNDDDLIPKNSTLTIARHPLPSGQKRVWEEEKLAPTLNNTSTSINSSVAKGTPAYSAISGGAFKKHETEVEATEDDKLSAMMDNSTRMYHQDNWVRGRGRGRGKPQGPPPPTYTCLSCNKSGHWRSDCPLGPKALGPDVKRTTGIPRSFLTPVPAGTPGAKLTPTGILMGIEMEKNAYEAKKSEKPVWENDEPEAVRTGVEIPKDLICPVCKDLLKDAIMMPSCACAMCDECARDSLIESDTNKCFACGEEENSPDDLIPWRQVRDKVNNFKNQSGYSKANKSTEQLEKPKPVPLGVKPTLPDIYLPGPKDVMFEKLLSNGQAPLEPQGVSTQDSQAIASSDSPVYGMAGPSPPNYAVSPTQQLAPSGFGINNSLPAIPNASDFADHNSRSSSRNSNDQEESTAKSRKPKTPDDDTPSHSRSRSNSPSETKTPPTPSQRVRSTSGSGSHSPKGRLSTRSPSASGASPRSRNVPLPDISQPPPSVHIHPNPSGMPPPGAAITQSAYSQPGMIHQTMPTSNVQPPHQAPMIQGPPGMVSHGTMPPVVGPLPGAFAVRLPATVPTHLPPHSVTTGPSDHTSHHAMQHLPPAAPHLPTAHITGPPHTLPAYNRPPPHHGMHEVPHDHRRGPPPGHGIPPPHMHQRNAYGIDKDGYIDDPLAAFERAMAMKDANKGRGPPPRYDGSRSPRRYYSPERRYGSRSPPRYRDRRSPVSRRRSPTPPVPYRDRRHSRSPPPPRPRPHSKTPEDRGQPRGPKTPPHPHPSKDGSATPPSVSGARHESPPPPPGTQSPESKRSPSRRNSPTPEKDSLQNITSTTQQSSTESKDRESSRSPVPVRQRSASPERDHRRNSKSPHLSREPTRRSPGPYYRRTPPPNDHYRYSPRRHSPPTGYDYPHGPPEQYYPHERYAPPPPEEFYDNRREGDYGPPHREGGYGPQREGGFEARNRYSATPYYRNEYRGRGHGYRGRGGRGYGYNQPYMDQRRQYFNEEHGPPPNYHRGHPDAEGSRRNNDIQPKRSRDRSPVQRHRSTRSQERESKEIAKRKVGENDVGAEHPRKEKSNSRERTPSLTPSPEPESRDQQEPNRVRERSEQDKHLHKTEDEIPKKEDNKENDQPSSSTKSLNNPETYQENLTEKDRSKRSSENRQTGNDRRIRPRSRSREQRGDRERDRDNRNINYRDYTRESQRSRNKDEEYYSRQRAERRDNDFINQRDRHRRSSGNHNRLERRTSEDRHYSSSRRRDHEDYRKDHDSDRYRQNEEEKSSRRERRDDKNVDKREKSPKEVEMKEKKKKDKKKKKKRDESANESGDHPSDTMAEKKKKKLKKEKKSKVSVRDTAEAENMPEIQTDRNDLGTRIEKDHGDDYDDQVILHNQEAFEDQVDSLEQVLESGDNQGSHNRESKDAKEIDSNLIPPATPEVSKWERSDGDDTIKDDNNSQEDRDLRELLKAKSSLSNLTPALKNTISLNDSVADKKQEPDYDKLIQEKLKDHERIDVSVGSEDDEMVESSDEMKNKRKPDTLSDSDTEEKTKKKRRKEKKQKKHKAKGTKKEEKKKSKKMLKELFGKDGLEKLLNKIDEGELPEDILAKAVLARTEKAQRSKSPSPTPQRNRGRRDHDTGGYEGSRSQGRESQGRRAVVSDGTSLKMTIDRNSPREERPRGKGDSIRRRSRDRSVDRRLRRRSRSNSTSRSPHRDYRKSDHLGSKTSDRHSSTSSKLLEVSAQSSSGMTSDVLEPQKRLSIKDRLGPIHSQGTKNKREANEDTYDDEGFGRDHWKGSNGPKPGKTERSNNTKRSPTRKEKWNDDKYIKRSRDKDLVSAGSPPPNKRRRDLLEATEINKEGGKRDRSQSPDRRDRQRRNLDEEKQDVKRDSDYTGDENNGNSSSTTKHKRTSARLEKHRSRIDSDKT